MDNKDFLFVNISNHPFDKWVSEQQRAALEITFDFGKALRVEKQGKELSDEKLRELVEVIDIPFPEIPLEWDEDFVYEWLLENYNKLLQRIPDVIMIQGEFTFTFFLVHLLMKVYPECDTTFVSAHSRRVCIENPDGTRTYKFEFDGFNMYRRKIPEDWDVSRPSWKFDPHLNMESLDENIKREDLEKFLQKMGIRVVEKRVAKSEKV